MRNIALSVVDDVHRVFTLCANMDWIDDKDPDGRTLAHEFLAIIMEDYLNTVRNEENFVDELSFEARCI